MELHVARAPGRTGPLVVALACLVCSLLPSVGQTPAPAEGAGPVGGAGATGRHGAMPMVEVPAEAMVPTARRLDRDGWAAALSHRRGGRGGPDAPEVLDGDAGSVRRLRVGPGRRSSITIDLGSPRTVSGLVYRPGERGAGRIGRYEVRISADGTRYGAPVGVGTWADDPSEKTAALAPRTARYVRLTVLTAAGGRARRVDVAELELLRPSVRPSVRRPTRRASGGPGAGGRWGPVTGLPIVPSSAALLPGNRLLLWSGAGARSYGVGTGRTEVAVVDLTTGRVSGRTVVDTDHEMFCTGISRLSDGRILITGGSDAGRTTIYDPRRNTWSVGPRLTIPRGYQTDVTLSDGRVLTLGGSWSGGWGGKDAEVLVPGGRWRRLPGVSARSIYTDDAGGVYRADNHAWLVATAGGGVFQAGPSRRMHWISTAGPGEVRSAGTRADDADAMNGSAVLYDVGRILTNGGSPSYEDSDATRNAFTIDIGAGPAAAPRVSRVGSMAAARAFHTSVVLPDGSVLVVGGQARAEPFTDSTAAMHPELWDPATGRFTTMAPMAVPRTYHSVALLLPDGRVWSGGGGLCGSCATNHPDGQVFTPPYLLQPDGGARWRPRITAAPAAVRPGATVRVRTSVAVRSFSLVRIGSVTHTVNSDQRRVPLRAGTRRGGGYDLRVPGSTGTVVPGDYLLFAIGRNGAPSVARTVNIRWRPRPASRAGGDRDLRHVP